MKILVMCPGSFTYGLNSPERGESRWSQNYARMLAQAGHDVYAASMGYPDPLVHYGVKLINEAHVAMHGPYDLYIDSSWWDNKPAFGKAKKYVCLKWSPEDYLREKPWPEDFYIAYPYTTHHYNFNQKNFPNHDRCFALPTMFGNDFRKPNWDKSAVFLPGKIDVNRPYKQYLDVIGNFLSKHPIEGTSRAFFETELGNRIDFNRLGSNWSNLIPYDQVLEAMGRSRISLPILNPGAIIEASFMGVPSVFWEHGGFYNPLARALNIHIEHDAPPERFTEVAELLMNDKKKHAEVVYTTQDYFSAHTFTGAMKYFNLMAETIGLL